jgi:cell division protein FtsX
MDLNFITQASQLGGTVFTVVAFLWYLVRTSDKQIESQVNLAQSLQKLTDVIERNTIESNKSTITGIENTQAVKGNTEVIDKNTEIITKTNGIKKP